MASGKKTFTASLDQAHSKGPVQILFAQTRLTQNQQYKVPPLKAAVGNLRKRSLARTNAGRVFEAIPDYSFGVICHVVQSQTGAFFHSLDLIWHQSLYMFELKFGPDPAMPN